MIIQGKLFNRGQIAQTGVIPVGAQFLQESFPLEIKDVKQVMVESAGGKKPVMRITGVFQKADDKNQNGRIYRKPILREAVEAIQTDISSRGVMGEFDHPCLITSDFRVLTVDGWKEFIDIKVGDYVWSRVNGRMVKSRVNSIVNDPYDGPVYEVNNRNINATFTPGHRFLLLKRPDYGDLGQIYATVEDIYYHRENYSHSPIPRTSEWVGNGLKIFKIPGVHVDNLDISVNRYQVDITKDLILDAKVFAAFLGLYLAEGNLVDNTGIVINQVSLGGREMIRQLFDTLELPYSENKTGFYLADLRLANYLRPLGNKYTKYIPQAVKELDAECLEQLVYWFAVGDGRIMKSTRGNRTLSCKGTINGPVIQEAALDLGTYSRLSVFTVSKQLVQDLHECIIKAGRCARLSVVEPADTPIEDRIIKAEDKVPLYQLSISRSHNIHLDPRFTTIVKNHHVGNIYCLSVDHGNFYMEHKGLSYWTGNSDAKIHLERVSHLITKVWMEGKLVYGEAEVIEDTTQGHNLAALLRAGVRIGISSRGVGDMEVVNEGSSDESYMVQDGYRFVTWDVVGEPSVQEAVMSVMESKNGIVTRAQLRNNNPKSALLHEIDAWLKSH